MFIKEISATQFKGMGDFHYTLGHITNAKGRNGSGKTSTLADSILWLFTDYGYALNNNPRVDNINAVESSPTVTVVCDFDGKEVTITKKQTIKTVTDGDTVKKSANNKYIINDIPVTQRDFKSKMLEYGINVDLILPLMHPMYFVSQKPMDQKKVLFQMTTEKTDLDIAQIGDNTLHLVELLKQYTVDEISAKYKASKKKADELIKSIPDQIQGMERSKSLEDPEPLYKRRLEIEEEISGILEEIDQKKESEAEGMSELREKLFAAQRELSDFEHKLKEDEVRFKRTSAEKWLGIQKSVSEQNDVIYTLRRQLDDAKLMKKRAEEQKTIATNKYRSLKAEKPPVYVEPKKLTEKDLVCPTCGQKLPEDLRKRKIDEYAKVLEKSQKQFETELKSWNAIHDKAIEDVTALGQTACDDIRAAEQKIAKTETAIKAEQEKLDALEKALNVAKKEESVPYQIPSEDEQTLNKLKEAVDHQMRIYKNADDVIRQTPRDDADDRITVLTEEKNEIIRRLAVIENNRLIDEKIEELSAERMKQEQAKATAEMILYELDLLSKKKNDLLVEEINSHFSLVKFQLFEYQKNGGYKEICVPTIDGYRFGESTNTGREIRGKLDICQSLQKFYGMSVPIILDNAESINEFNLPEIDSQLILLTVTDDEKLVVEHD